MARAALRRRLTWQAATVISLARETASVCKIELDPPNWPGHRAGQHLEVRLTAEDGYTAERSYSIASAPGEPLAITVERLDDGEVSPYLPEELPARGRAGAARPDRRLLRGGARRQGPAAAGRWVGHRPAAVHPAVPSPHWQRRPCAPVVLLPDAAGRDLPRRARPVPRRHGVTYTLTRSQPPGWTGHTGRIDTALLAEVAWPAAATPLALICGPTSFVETAAAGLVGLGYPPERVKTERFGSTGGR